MIVSRYIDALEVLNGCGLIAKRMEDVTSSAEVQEELSIS